MIRNSLIAGALALASFAGTDAGATTTTVLSGSGARSITLPYAAPVGQTFTAVDSLLTSFGFQMEVLNTGYANTPLTLSIYAGTATSGTALASVNVTATPLVNYGDKEWVDFGLNDLALTIGDTYTAIIASTSYRFGMVYGPDINIYTGQVLGTDAYAGGQYVSSQIYDNFCKGSTSICDANFRFTGTTPAPAPVPEPASWMLMIGGFGMIGGGLRHRRATIRFA